MINHKPDDTHQRDESSAVPSDDHAASFADEFTTVETPYTDYRSTEEICLAIRDQIGALLTEAGTETEGADFWRDNLHWLNERFWGQEPKTFDDFQGQAEETLREDAQLMAVAEIEAAHGNVLPESFQRPVEALELDQIHLTVTALQGYSHTCGNPEDIYLSPRVRQDAETIERSDELIIISQSDGGGGIPFSSDGATLISRALSKATKMAWRQHDPEQTIVNPDFIGTIVAEAKLELIRNMQVTGYHPDFLVALAFCATSAVTITTPWEKLTLAWGDFLIRRSGEEEFIEVEQLEGRPIELRRGACPQSLAFNIAYGDPEAIGIRNDYDETLPGQGEKTKKEVLAEEAGAPTVVSYVPTHALEEEELATDGRNFSQEIGGDGYFPLGQLLGTHSTDQRTEAAHLWNLACPIQERLQRKLPDYEKINIVKELASERSTFDDQHKLEFRVILQAEIDKQFGEIFQENTALQRSLAEKNLSELLEYLIITAEDGDLEYDGERDFVVMDSLPKIAQRAKEILSEKFSMEWCDVPPQRPFGVIYDDVSSVVVRRINGDSSS